MRLLSNSWTFLTEIQVVVTSLSGNASDYTLPCDKFTPLSGDGYEIGSDAITASTGTNGIRITGNTDGYTANSIFLPAAGFGYGSDLSSAPIGGNYWSSTQYDSSRAYDLFFNLVYGSSNVSYISKSYGCAVRPVRSSL